MLPFLGLEVGKYGKEGTDVTVPPNKLGRPGKEGNPVELKKFSWNWGVYTILAKMPGGMAKTRVLFEMCLEWCPVLEGEDRKTAYDSCRHSLWNKKHFFLTPVDNKKRREPGGLYRLTNIGEQQKSNPGPKKGVNPRENWGKTRASSQSSQEEDEDDEMAAPEEPSVTNPQYSISSQQGPTLNTYREIDEFEAAQAQAQAAQTSTSGSSSPQNSPGDTESPLFSPAETQEEAVRQWTPVNRSALVPLVLRTPLPSGPAKRKSDKEDNDSKQPTLKRQRSL